MGYALPFNKDVRIALKELENAPAYLALGFIRFVQYKERKIKVRRADDRIAARAHQNPAG
jgi:hypothetical protein